MIIDAHTHVGVGSPHYGRSKNFSFSGRFTGTDLLALMDTVGIDRCLCFAMGTRLSDEGIRLSIDAVQKHPDRLRAFYWANPYDPRSVKGFEQAVKEYGLSGLKLHPTSDGWQADDHIVDPLMEKAAELGVPCTIHSHQPGSQPTLVGEMAARWPTVPVIMAHMGMHNYKDAIYVAVHQPNVILESSVQPWIHRIARGIVDRIGPERLMYGSDAPLHHPKVEMTKIEVSFLTDDQRKMVMGENIRRLLKWD